MGLPTVDQMDDTSEPVPGGPPLRPSQVPIEAPYTVFIDEDPPAAGATDSD